MRIRPISGRFLKLGFGQGPLDAYLKKLVPTPEFTRILAKHFGESNAEFLASEVGAAKE